MAILDSITANLAYGFRRLKTSGITNACRVKNTTTNVETDLAVGFSKATADALVSAGQELVILKFYDQSGNGNDLESVGSAHGKLKFDDLEVPYLEKTSANPDIRLRTVSSLTFTAPKFFSLVYFTNNSDGWFTCMAPGVAFISRIVSGSLGFYNGNGVIFGSLSTNAWHQITSYFKSGNDRAFVDGSEQSATSGADAGDTAQTAKLVLLRQDNDSNGAVQGRWRELIYIEGTVSDVNRAAIEADQTASLTPPDTTAPAAITDLTFDSKNSTSITGHFTAPTDASGIGGYEIRVNGGGWSPLSVTGTTTKSFTKTGLTPNTAHTLEVRSYDGVATPNYSAASNSITQTTWNTAPTITNATQLSNAQLNQSYTETIVTAGGDGTRTLSVTPGHSLPAWLSLSGNNLTGTHNALATDELIYLRVTDSNGQYNDYVLELSTVDEVVPSDVSTLVVTQTDDFSISAASSGASDNSGSVTFVNQRSSDNFVSDIVTLASTAEDFTDTVAPSVETTYKWRQKAKDGSNNVSANWKVSNALTFTPPPVPEIITESPLPIARTGHSYTKQLEKTGGSGSGSWSAISGNLPEDALDENGLITIADVADEDYVFTALFEDENGTEDEKEFTIPVTEMAVWEFSYQRPLVIELAQWQRIFEPLLGNDEVIEDKAEKRIFNLKVQYYDLATWEEIIDFLYEHRLRKHFLFRPERDTEYTICKLIKAPSEAQLRSSGGFEVVIQEV